MNWTNINPTAQPTQRYSVRCVHDLGRKIDVAIGGNTSEVSEVLTNETWEWNGTIWVKNTGAISAPYVRSCGLAYGTGDGVGGDKRVILACGFGSPNGIAPNSYQRWVYQYDGNDWAVVLPGGVTPKNVAYPAFSYFPDRDSYVLYGGKGLYSEFTSYELYADGGGNLQWRNANAGSIPGPRHGSALAYDVIEGDVVFFGGRETDAGTDKLHNDTYVFDSSGTWSWLNTTASPSSRCFHSMYFDETLGGIVLFGGLVNISPATWDNQIWFLDRSGINPEWVNLTSLFPATPSARGDAPFWFNSFLQQGFLFGGRGSLLNDTWGFTTGAIDANLFNFSTETFDQDSKVSDVRFVGRYE